MFWLLGSQQAPKRTKMGIIKRIALVGGYGVIFDLING